MSFNQNQLTEAESFNTPPNTKSTTVLSCVGDPNFINISAPIGTMILRNDVAKAYLRKYTGEWIPLLSKEDSSSDPTLNQFIGRNNNETHPNYSSTTTVAQGSSLTEAISQLDSKLNTAIDLTEIHNELNELSVKVADNSTSITNIELDISSINTDIGDLGDRLTVVETTSQTHTTSINSLNTITSTHTDQIEDIIAAIGTTTPTQHNSLDNIDGGDTVNDYYGHNTELMQNRQINAGNANGYLILDNSGVIPTGNLPPLPSTTPPVIYKQDTASKIWGPIPHVFGRPCAVEVIDSVGNEFETEVHHDASFTSVTIYLTILMSGTAILT